MSTATILGLLSCLLGGAGAALLFQFSYALEALEGAPFGGPILAAANAAKRSANQRRSFWQRVGFLLILGGYVAQIVALLL